MTGRLPRRRFLATSGLLGTVGLTGCTALSGGTTDSQSDDDSDHDDGGHDEMDHESMEEESFSNDHLPFTEPPEMVDINERGDDITIQVTPARHYLHSDERTGGPMELPLVWTFTPEDGTPSVPSPVLRVQEGSEFSITVENHDETAHDHTFHLHAVERPWKDDGSPEMTGEVVEHEGAKTYNYTADVPGTHLYHCHVETPLHMDMGMFGLLRVDPSGTRTPGAGTGGRANWEEPDDFGRTGYRDVDREYFMTLREWDTGVSDFHAGMLGGGMDHDMEDGGMAEDGGMEEDEGMDEDGSGMDEADGGMDHGHMDHGDGYDVSERDPDAFTLNGKSAPTTFDEDEGTLIVVEEGDTVRVHFANTGYTNHTMHTHNHRFRVVEKDGSPIPEGQQIEQDTLNIGSAERYTIEFEADTDPGVYPFHCHRLDHTHNHGEMVGGMMTAIVYESAMDSDVFQTLAEHEEAEHGEAGHDDHDH